MRLPKGTTAAYLLAIIIGAACLYFGLRAAITTKTALLLLFGAVMVLGGVFGLTDLSKKRRQAAEKRTAEKEENPR
ncbi:MAG: hypothetical protein IJT76_03045 [Clostridia bacterium]|nr:hypothetical protein [Clostridia bacterium]